MSLDITPRTPAGRQIIEAYGDGGFRVSGVQHDGAVLVFLNATLAWSGVLTFEGLRPILERADKPEILIVGCGPTFTLPPEALRQALRASGIALEWMDTPAACRTYNVLAIEERSVAAAILAVG